MVIDIPQDWQIVVICGIEEQRQEDNVADCSRLDETAGITKAQLTVDCVGEVTACDVEVSRCFETEVPELV